MLELDEDIALKSSIDETLHDGTSFFFILKSYSVTRDDDDENCIFNTKYQDQDVIKQSSTTTTFTTSYQAIIKYIVHQQGISVYSI